MGNEEVDLVTVVKPQEKRSLLQKYDIPVERLSYEYVTQCSNVKEVEHIVLILRSGEEGIFPDLIKHAEKCLVKISPNSKVLRVEEPVLTRAMLEPEDRKIIDEDIARWMNEMQGREKDLEEGKALSLTLPIPQPEIRQTPEAPRLLEPGANRTKQKSIASCDYSGWDKFDADAELDRIDLREERNQAEAKNAQRKQREKFERAKKLSRESMVNKLTLTATELAVMAEQEKNIGNEAYRAGDYEEALIRYNSSIAINSTANAYNNRAITNIKLRRYQDAVTDCNVVLSMEYNNVTALMRRGLALENLERKSEALVDYQTILRLEPNNKIAIAAVNKLRKPSDSKKVRMKIEEECSVDAESGPDVAKEQTTGKSVEEANDSVKHGLSEICFCDRAPGFSRSPKPPPHCKSIYCLPAPRAPSGRKVVGHSKSQNSYFSGMAISGPNDNPRKLIIEESPSDESARSKYESECDPRSRKVAEIEAGRKPGTEVDHFVKNNDAEKWKKKVQGSGKPELRLSSQQKIIDVASKYEKPGIRGGEKMPSKDPGPVESPYEFLNTWESLKNDVDLSLRAKLLRSLAPEDLAAVIGNKLDGDMFGVILRCLESHFCRVEDARLIHRFMNALTKLSRFSIVHLFMDVDDKEVLKKILNFLDDEDVPPAATAALREAYNV